MPGPQVPASNKEVERCTEARANESIWGDASVGIDIPCAPANFPFSPARFVLEGFYFKEPHHKTDLNIFISRGSDGAENILGSHRNIVWIRCYLGTCNCTYSDYTLNKSIIMVPQIFPPPTCTPCVIRAC